MSEIELPNSELSRKLLADDAYRAVQKRLEQNKSLYSTSDFIESVQTSGELTFGHTVTRAEFQDTIFLKRGSARYSIEQITSAISHETLHLVGLRQRIPALETHLDGLFAKFVLEGEPVLIQGQWFRPTYVGESDPSGVPSILIDYLEKDILR